IGQQGGGRHHSGTRRRRPHDHRHAAGQYPGSRRARPGRTRPGRTQRRASPRNSISVAMSQKNPLLSPISSLIDYSRVTPEHIEPAIAALIDETRAAVERGADPSLPATWEAIVEPLEDASEKLWRAWSVAGHLNAVVNTPELRAAYNQCLPLVTEFSTWVGLHEGLYAQYK